MDPVSLIVAALAAGAATGVGDSAASAVQDLYDELKRRLLERFAGKGAAETAVEAFEADPDTWKAPLAKAVREERVAADQAILAVAQRLLELADEDAASGKYRIDLQGAAGVQVGDNNEQTNTFGTPLR